MFYKFLWHPIGLMNRVFVNGSRDRGSIPSRVITKTQKMVLDAVMPNIQHYKVRMLMLLWYQLPPVICHQRGDGHHQIIPIPTLTHEISRKSKQWLTDDLPEHEMIVFTNGRGDRGSIPDRVIPKTQNMVLVNSLLNSQHYKVQIKGKVEQSREWSSALSYTSV